MESYLPLWGFIVLMVATPGPANMLLMAAGASVGFARLLPFLLGLLLGKLAMNIAISLGFGTVLVDQPAVSTALAYASAGLMVFLVFRGWTPAADGGGETRTFSLPVGMIVHPLNPKAWTMTTLAFTQFSGGFETGFERFALIPLSFLAVQLVFHSLWGIAGVTLRRRLSQNLALHRALILLTVAVIVWALFQ